MRFVCKDVAIIDHASQTDWKTVGEFSGTIEVDRDMCRPTLIEGAARMRENDAEVSFKLEDLFVDLCANDTKVYCLFNDPKWKEPEA
jgi:hypothetical protein